MTTTPTVAEIELALALKHESLRKRCLGGYDEDHSDSCCNSRGWLPDCSLEKLLEACLERHAVVSIYPKDIHGRYGASLYASIYDGSTPQEALLHALYAATKEGV